MAIRSGIQLCYPFEERRLLNQGRFSLQWAPPYILQPKLNGERCRMLVDNGRCLLLSSSEDIIPAVPHINQAGLMLPNGEYDGELYKHGLKWNEIHSIVSRETTLHPNYQIMEYHIFDVVESGPQYSRLQTLSQLKIPLTGCIRKVVPSFANNLREVLSLYDEYIEKGYEGFVIRHIDALYTRKRNPALMKFKPKKRDHYEIARVIEAVSEDGIPLGMVGAFECKDDMGTYFKVGAGKLSHDERREIWNTCLNTWPSIVCQYLEIEYQTMSDSKGVPLFSRALRIVDSKPENGNED